MTNEQNMVREFHEKFGVPVQKEPAINRGELRAKLIMEEALETVTAIRGFNLPEAVDGLCDLIYVCFGAALEFGVDLQPFFREVHRTNMEKEGGAMRADGKILKPEGWQPPDIAGMIARGEGRIW